MPDYESNMLDQVLPQNELFELILTTENADGTVNAAPVGVVRNGSRAIIELSASTNSLRNIKSTGSGLLNLVTDPLAFAESAFGTCTKDFWVQEGSVKRLRKAKATISVALGSCEDFVKEDRLRTTRFVRVILDITGLKIHLPPSPYSRKQSAAIEAVVAVTKARVAFERDLIEIFEEMVEYVNRLSKIAGGPDGSAVEAFALCFKQLESIRGGRDRE